MPSTEGILKLARRALVTNLYKLLTLGVRMSGSIKYQFFLLYSENIPDWNFVPYVAEIFLKIVEISSQVTAKTRVVFAGVFPRFAPAACIFIRVVIGSF